MTDDRSRPYTCHLEDIDEPVSHGRIYLPGHSFDARDPYELAFLVRWISDRSVEICGIDKLPDKQMIAIAQTELARRGVGSVSVERHGRRRQVELPNVSETFSPHPYFLSDTSA